MDNRNQAPGESFAKRRTLLRIRTSYPNSVSDAYTAGKDWREINEEAHRAREIEFLARLAIVKSQIPFVP